MKKLAYAVIALALATGAFAGRPPIDAGFLKQ
jgi:hypothetical protein